MAALPFMTGRCRRSPAASNPFRSTKSSEILKIAGLMHAWHLLLDNNSRQPHLIPALNRRLLSAILQVKFIQPPGD
jgi:hypothetical protein